MVPNNIDLPQLSKPKWLLKDVKEQLDRSLEKLCILFLWIIFCQNVHYNVNKSLEKYWNKIQLMMHYNGTIAFSALFSQFECGVFTHKARWGNQFRVLKFFRHQWLKLAQFWEFNLLSMQDHCLIEMLIDFGTNGWEWDGIAISYV